MAFRNDQDALRARTEAAERELARTREELEERDQAATEAETRTAVLERELEEAREALAGYAPEPVSEPVSRPSAPSPLVLVLVVLATLAVTAVVGAVLSAPEVAPVETPRLPTTPRLLEFEAPADRALAVAAIEGTAPIADDAGDCTLSISPESRSSGFNCRVRVRCGLVDVYGGGGSGWNMCQVSDGQVATVLDAAHTDGDPELHFDAAARTLRVHDAPPEGEWTLAFTVLSE